MGVAAAIDQPLDMHEHIGPHGLWAGIAAPGAPDRTGDQKQADRSHDQQACDIIKFVRPDLDVEDEETAIGDIDQHRLVRRVRPTIPADPGRDVIDRQGHHHDDPFETAERAVDLSRKDLFAGFEKVVDVPVG